MGLRQSRDKELHDAIGKCDLDLVKHLVESGVSVNGIHSDCSALYTAAEAGHVGIVNYLLQQGAQLTSGPRNDTALRCSAKAGDVEVCRALVQADVHRDSDNNYPGSTPLTAAVSRGHTSVVHLLLRAGWDPNAGQGSAMENDLVLHQAVSEENAEMVDLLCRFGASVHKQDGFGRTALHMACQTGCRTLVNLLLHYNSDVNLADNESTTPLHVACRGGHLDIVKRLLAQDCILDGQRTGWGVEGFTALHEATKNDQERIVEVLCQAGADTGIRDYYLRTPLLLAGEMGNDAILRTLIRYGCNVDLPDLSQTTVLTIACKYRKPNIVKRLLEVDCDLNAKDVSDRTALHHAAEKGCSESVELLLVHGANLAVQDKYGMTPLQYAVTSGYIKCTFLMLQHGHHLPQDECKASELIQMVMKRQKDDTIQLLVQLGWRPKTVGFNKVTEFLRSTMAVSYLVDWLEKEICSPLSLMRRARNIVRKRLTLHTNNTTIFPAIDQLRVPSEIQDYLKLYDIYDCYF